MGAPLQYLLITVKVVALEKVSFSDTQNPKAAFLTQPIQMELSENKTVSQIFFVFLKSILNFKHLPAKDDPLS